MPRFLRFLVLGSLSGLVLLAPLGCGDAEEDAETASGPAAPRLSAGELRQAYDQYLAALADTMPASQLLEPGKLYPVDEALADSAFFVFREALRAAVRERDILNLLPHVADSIEGPGGERGLAAFTARWGLETESLVRESDLWEVLDEALGQGGAFLPETGHFAAPYPYATFPRDTYEPGAYGAVTGAGVRMRATPALNSTILTLVSHDIVPVLELGSTPQTIGGETHPWVKLRSPDGQEGYVWGKYLWHPGKYHAVFTREGGSWLLSRLATGA